MTQSIWPSDQPFSYRMGDKNDKDKAMTNLKHVIDLEASEDEAAADDSQLLAIFSEASIDSQLADYSMDSQLADDSQLDAPSMAVECVVEPPPAAK